LFADRSEPFDVKYARVLWSSQFAGDKFAGNTLKDPIDTCVIQKIGQLLSRQNDETATRLREEITEALRGDGYELDSYFS
jgi:hypothetical protein